MKMGSRSSAARESPVVSTALNTASAIRITRAMNACRVPLRTTVASGLVENAKTRFELQEAQEATSSVSLCLDVMRLGSCIMGEARAATHAGRSQ
jgi:hypothetical protein